MLLLDEPASGLDREARRSLSGLVTRLAGEGMTIVVSSHILAELEASRSPSCTGPAPRSGPFSAAARVVR